MYLCYESKYKYSILIITRLNLLHETIQFTSTLLITNDILLL